MKLPHPVVLKEAKENCSLQREETHMPSVFYFLVSRIQCLPLLEFNPSVWKPYPSRSSWERVHRMNFWSLKYLLPCKLTYSLVPRMRMWAYWKLITLTAVDPKDSCPSWNRFVPFQDLPESQVAALSSHLILIITKAQISLSKSSKLGIDETHYIIHPQAKFHSICESVKLENILSAPQILKNDS